MATIELYPDAPQGYRNRNVTLDIDADVAAINRIDAVSAILDVVCRVTGMGFAAVARVTADRWVACAVRDDIQFGLSAGGELPVKTTICDTISKTRVPVIIDFVDEDLTYSTHPTPAMYGFKSYISVPIILPDQTFFGTLCAIDPRPAELSRPEVVEMFALFANLIAMHLDAQRRVTVSEAALTRELETADIREQFIAVLGHDLRNPLAAIDAGVRLLRKEKIEARDLSVLSMIESSVGRMAELIDNVLDLARGRLGGGLTVTRTAETALAAALEQVVDELRVTWPDRTVRTHFVIAGPVHCDRARVAQLLSNLVANALTHGASDHPVDVHVDTTSGVFELSVANAGDPIAPDTARRLFLPFFRGASPSAGQGATQGLGLGLYIASEIARAHDGALEVASLPDETRFTLRMPLA